MTEDVAPTVGIFEDFLSYRTPNDEQLAAVLRTGIVALDTNVLLDLYRYGQDARNELLGLLVDLSKSLYVPHQVMTEFWKRRVGVLEEVGSSGSENELRKAKSSVEGILDRWRGRTRGTLKPST